MKKFVLCMMLVATASPAWSQTKPKATTTRADPCAPIGQTASHELIYSMSCTNLPAPPAPPPQVEVQQAPPEPEPSRGLFGMSFDRSGGSGGQGRSQ
jgi:hypothetical protein